MAAPVPNDFITAELLNPRPNGPLLWRVGFGASVLDAFICDAGCWGVAYRLYLNGRFTYSERFETPDLAQRAALGVFGERLAEGWVEEHLAIPYDAALSNLTVVPAPVDID